MDGHGEPAALAVLVRIPHQLDEHKGQEQGGQEVKGAVLVAGHKEIGTGCLLPYRPCKRGGLQQVQTVRHLADLQLYAGIPGDQRRGEKGADFFDPDAGGEGAFCCVPEAGAFTVPFAAGFAPVFVAGFTAAFDVCFASPGLSPEK